MKKLVLGFSFLIFNWAMIDSATAACETEQTALLQCQNAPPGCTHSWQCSNGETCEVSTGKCIPASTNCFLKEGWTECDEPSLEPGSFPICNCNSAGCTQKSNTLKICRKYDGCGNPMGSYTVSETIVVQVAGC